MSIQNIQSFIVATYKKVIGKMENETKGIANTKFDRLKAKNVPVHKKR